MTAPSPVSMLSSSATTQTSLIRPSVTVRTSMVRISTGRPVGAISPRGGGQWTGVPAVHPEHDHNGAFGVDPTQRLRVHVV